MESHAGVLHMLGESVHASQTNFINYSFIKIGNQMLGSVKVSLGLNGILDAKVGEDLTLHIRSNKVWAITDKSGQTYATPTPYPHAHWIVLILGEALTIFSTATASSGAGKGFFWGTLVSLGLGAAVWGFSKLFFPNIKAEFPNAIMIPVP